MLKQLTHVNVWVADQDEALEHDELIHEAPAIVGRQTPSALAHAAKD